jgi:hypothetical protein
VRAHVDIDPEERRTRGHDVPRLCHPAYRAALALTPTDPTAALELETIVLTLVDGVDPDGDVVLGVGALLRDVPAIAKRPVMNAALEVVRSRAVRDEARRSRSHGNLFRDV